jgi:hypothetical protein
MLACMLSERDRVCMYVYECVNECVYVSRQLLCLSQQQRIDLQLTHTVPACRPPTVPSTTERFA